MTVSLTIFPEKNLFVVKKAVGNILNLSYECHVIKDTLQAINIRINDSYFI